MPRRPPVSPSRGSLARAALSLVLTAGLVQPAMALELIVFDADWCAPCRKFKKEVLPEWRQSELGARIRLELKELRDQGSLGIELAEKVSEVPVFVLVADGVEVGRIVGYSTSRKFWAELREQAEPHLDAATDERGRDTTARGASTPLPRGSRRAEQPVE